MCVKSGLCVYKRTFFLYNGGKVRTMKFSFYTLGCKVNQYETQALERLVTEMGHALCRFGEPCDCCIINTCTVTAVSDKKCRNAIRRARALYPDAAIGVCGCYAQVAPEAIRALGADVILGTADRAKLPELLLACVEDRQKRECWEPAREHRTFEILPAGGLAERTRAMLKVEDGCSNFCTYCIIPYARGPVRSLPVENAVRQAQECREAGYRELVVTGIEISSWGIDLPGKPVLTDLLEAVCAAVPDTRIRLGSLEPRMVTEDFCRRMQKHKNLCPQFHLSLQSGCDSVLKRMHRKYDTARYLESVQLLRACFPGCAVTTDLIAGFPGETEEEFAASLDFLKTCGFAACHIFPYSRRSGTPADRMDGQLSAAEKEARAGRAIECAAELEKAYLKAQIGTVQEVLWEQPEDGYYAGHAPNYVKVYTEGEALRNRVLPCRITGLFRDGVLCEIQK